MAPDLPNPFQPRAILSRYPRLVIFTASLVLVSTILVMIGLRYQDISPLDAITIRIFPQNNHLHCPSQCPMDPFTKPGLIVHGNYDSDARWLPFVTTPLSAVPLHSSDIQSDSAIPDAVLDMACPQYMKMLANSTTESSEVDWAKDKTVLFIGSSHDRNNIEYFCGEVGGSYASIGGHTAAFCNVTSHNLVFALWFIYGAVDSEAYDWYQPFESRPITFERKIQEVMLPWMKSKGISDPDLVIESSLFWDDSFFNQRSRHLNQTTRVDTSLSYSELAWHRSRVHALVEYTRSLYRIDIPIMFRTRHIRESNRWNRILRIFQLDQSLRAVAQELNIKLFTWGDMLEGVTSFYDGDQHFHRGPVTWLFGDMVLFYLKQATTASCWDCHT